MTVNVGVAAQSAPPDQERNETIDQVLNRLQTQRTGLTSDEVQRRLIQYGSNVLAEKEVSALRKLLGYFWGPIPWMIEVAAVLSAVIQHWADLIIIAVLLVINAAIGFWQEYQAGNAIEQLKKRLALKARALRDGQWSQIPAQDLVPGDIVQLRLGDVIPADIHLVEGNYLSVDQSALTGESLPVDRKVGDIVYSGSVAKLGEMVGVVAATGMETFFGRTVHLVESAKTVSHFQKAVLTIGDYLIYLSVGLVAVLIIVELNRHVAFMTLMQFALILTVAAIPVAMPAVLSATMAVGAFALSRVKAIVSRLEVIEEMAGIDILCSDKTGTLTQNQLTLGEPIVFDARDVNELLLTGALACEAANQDAIDLAVLRGLKDPAALAHYQQTQFTPFDPVRKRADATVRGPDGTVFQVTKGAPQVVIGLSRLDEEMQHRATRAVDELAAKGFRTLGVARSEDGQHWQFLGLLPLFDPPREDAAQTIRQAQTHGIDVKMVTGDNIAIAKEIAGELGLGIKILPAGDIAAQSECDVGGGPPRAADALVNADGYAEVFPEHKYNIVKALQGTGHLVGMTGDGVNDAPALKQADVGIAVAGATDAARTAADLVLTVPGLSVIVNAVEEARRIFERMNSYAIYRITETIRIMIFVVLAMVVYNLYPITTVMLILLALLNDLPIMTIAFDNTWLDPLPVRWNMRRILTLASVLGSVGVAETFLLMYIATHWFHTGGPQLQSVIFLKLSVAGHLTLFVARTRRPFFLRPFPAPILLIAILATQAVAAVVVGFGLLVAALPWSYVGMIWAYCIVWVFIEDLAKLLVYKHIGLEAPHHRRFLGILKKGLHSHTDK